MSNPFAPSDFGYDVPDPWMRYVPWILYVVGALYMMLALGSGLMLGALGGLVATVAETSEDTVTAAMSGVYAVIMLVVCIGFGAVNFAVGAGFARGTKVAWFGAVILGAIYFGSACMPFGIAILYGALNDRTRKAFLG